MHLRPKPTEDFPDAPSMLLWHVAEARGFREIVISHPEGQPPTALCMICRCSLRGVNRFPKTIILLSSPATTLDRRCSIESIPNRATGAGSIISIRVIGVFFWPATSANDVAVGPGERTV